MAKLFVSYSRRDSAAARKLIECFRSIEQEVWVDWESIPPAVDWLEQIFRGIEEADAFIFLISPDSIDSEVCKVEVARAALNNKRIIPIVLHDVDPKITPESIRKLNWTYMRENDSFEEGLAKVKTAIELDLDWLEEHRRLQVRSLEWHRKKDPSLLLRGRDLRNARHMLATATSKDPTPTDLQRMFIEYSWRSDRNRTIAWIATGITVIAMAILSFLAVRASNEAQVQRGIAEVKAVEASNNAVRADENRKVAEANAAIAKENEALARENEQKAEDAKKLAEAQRSAARAQIYQSRPGELYTSTLLAIDSMQRSESKEAEEILRQNISLLPLPVAQVSQSGKINAIAFNPSGDSFVTASSDGTACAWKIENGKQIFCATSPQSVNDVAFNSDGTFIATGDASGLVQVLDASNGNILHEYQRVKPESAASTVQVVDIKNESSQDESTPLEIPVRSISIRPGAGQQLAIAYDDGEIPVLDSKTGKISSPLEISGRPHVSGFSSSGLWLAAGSDSGIVTIWNLSDRKIVSNLKHRDGVLAMAFSPNGQSVATGGKDNTAVITNLRTGQELARIPNQNWVRAIAFSPDSSWLVTASDDHRIRIWDATTGKERLGMSQDGIVTDVAVSSNGQWIATTGDDRTARVWNAATGAEIFQIPLGSAGSVLGFSSDGKYLISTDQRGAINIWDISVMAAPEKTIQFNGIVDNVQYSPSGGQLAVSDENRVWMLTPNPLANLSARPLGSPITFKAKVKSLTFSPDSKLLGILTEGNEAAFYNLENRGLKTLKVSSLIQAIAFSPDSQQFITSDSAGKLQTWNITNAELVSTSEQKYIQALSLATSPEILAIGLKDKISIVDGLRAVPGIDSTGDHALLVFSQDGSLLASSDSSGEINIWKYQEGNFTAVKSFVKDQAASLAFNPRGSLLAIGTAKNVYLVAPTTGEEIARIPHIDIVNGVSFSADGSILATASSRVLQFWEVTKIQPIKRNDLIQIACSRLIANFSKAQWSAFFGDVEYKTLCENLPPPQ